MSGGTKSVRQPGGRRPYLTAGHYPCGVCKDGCMPKAMAIELNGFQSLGGCCVGLNPSANKTYGLSPDASVQDNCIRANQSSPNDSCRYTHRVDSCGFHYDIDVEISCVDTGGGNFVLQVNVDIIGSQDGDPTATRTVASSSWQSSVLSGGCGSADCSALSASGTFTVFDNTYCALGTNPSPTWSLTSSGCDDCTAAAGLPCCCGGPPLPRCYCLQINDPALCDMTQPVYVEVCYDKASNTYKGANGATTATMWYTTSPNAWHVAYSCPFGSNTVILYEGDDGWRRVGGSIALTWQAGDANVTTDGPVPCPRCGGACTTLSETVTLRMTGSVLPRNGTFQLTLSSIFDTSFHGCRWDYDDGSVSYYLIAELNPADGTYLFSVNGGEFDKSLSSGRNCTDGVGGMLLTNHLPGDPGATCQVFYAP